MDGRKKRDGRVIELLGFYDPVVRDPDKQFALKLDRIDYCWALGLSRRTRSAGSLTVGVRRRLAAPAEV